MFESMSFKSANQFEVAPEQLPQPVLVVAETLERAGFEAYLVGGCVRDMALGGVPKDWDFTTNAKPEEIQALYQTDETFCNNAYGTIGIKNDVTTDETLKVIEVTPYRSESGYSDRRRPDTVTFGVSLAEDVKRRDFTVNALAWRPATGEFVDNFNGLDDLAKKRLKAVGDPSERFQEDALRLMRAVRLATQLNFAIENETMEAIMSHSQRLESIASERIRDEFLKILDSNAPLQGIVMLERLRLLEFIMPELKAGIGCEQGGVHKFDVYEHLLRTVQAAADREFSQPIRLAALLHDIAKPATRGEGGKNKRYTFYNHEVEGARQAEKIMRRLKVPRETTEKVVKLVRWHMFFADSEEVTLAAVRRTVNRVGEENIHDLLKLRRCDRIGTGRPKEDPHRLRKYEAMVDEVLRDPISVKNLKTNGHHIMEKFGEKPGKRLGYIKDILLGEVLENPAHNVETYLDNRAGELVKLPESELEVLANKARGEIDAKEDVALQAIARAHKVA